MTRLLYDLAGADETLRFSPFCWRAKLALAHKNLEYETVPWRFTEKDEIAFSGQGKVPVLDDSGTIVADSQAIAEYLEKNYPNEASLFGEPPSRALTMFIKAWTEDVLQSRLVPVLIPDIFARLHPKDRAYFRESREGFLKRPLEAFIPERAEHEAAFRTALKPLRRVLTAQDFIAGAAPTYADHIVFGALAWARLTSSTPLLQDEPKILGWMDAVLETYGLPLFV